MSNHRGTVKLGDHLSLHDLSESLQEDVLDVDPVGDLATPATAAAAEAADAAVAAAAATTNAPDAFALMENNLNSNSNNDSVASTSNQNNQRQVAPRPPKRPAKRPYNSNTEGPPTKRVPDSVEQSFRRLRSAKDKELRYKSHREYLSKYLREGKAPLGLQINLKPCLGSVSEDFQKQWDAVLLDCSLRLVHLTIDRCTEQLETLSPEIEALTTQIKGKIRKTEAKEVLNFVDELVNRRAATLTAKKDKKFTADKAGKRGLRSPGKVVKKPKKINNKDRNIFDFLTTLAESYKSLTK